MFVIIIIIIIDCWFPSLSKTGCHRGQQKEDCSLCRAWPVVDDQTIFRFHWWSKSTLVLIQRRWIVVTQSTGIRIKEGVSCHWLKRGYHHRRQDLFLCAGLESVITRTNARRVRNHRRQHMDTIVSRQDMCSPETLSLMSMQSSRLARKRAHKLAVIYFKTSLSAVRLCTSDAPSI